jgi:hypothetical protein
VVDFDLPAVEIGLQQFVRRTGEVCGQQISRIPIVFPFAPWRPIGDGSHHE